MSTLTDLFNIRIGFSKKVVVMEKLYRGIQLWSVESRLPIRDAAAVRYASSQNPETLLETESVTKEDVYYILPPSEYYRNTLRFPFSEQQKIEAVIKYEVDDYLPVGAADCCTDFYGFEGWASRSKKEVMAFSVEKEKLRRMLGGFGRYAENVKAVVPLDIALFHAVRPVVETDRFVFLDIQDDAAYVCLIRGGVLKSAGFYTNRDPSRYETAIRSGLLVLTRDLTDATAYVNVRRSTGDEFRELSLKVLEGIGVSYRNISWNGHDIMTQERADASLEDTVAMGGLLSSLNQAGVRGTNLLKEEFRPKLKGYVSIKEFIILGVLLLVLLAFSTANIVSELRFNKSRAALLNRTLDEISVRYFKKSGVDSEETKRLLGDVQSRIRTIQGATDRRFSCTQLFKEFTSTLPLDVDIEYTDIIVERDHIKFYGKTKTFSDIDRIQESLSMSDYFTAVEVSNTGTTGSSEGFAVTFVFDIDVSEE
ncbi:MAG: hypothetical protein JXQ30_13450 [Spirochaetes bacterium]|nr:hypothetical protein [Spirochaetota bacterium]